MTDFKSDFLRIARERGFIHQCTDARALDAKLARGQTVAYVGYDCTADSLHIGHLVSIMMMRWFQKTGHKPIALMGGGTSKVGDPSGKDETRKLLSEADIASNMLKIRSVFERLLTFGSGDAAAALANNADWLDSLRYISFLREYGRHFSVNRMLSFDSVKLRLDRDRPLSFLEFNYMILQAYDFVELHRRYGCALQMGGSDQWGNIVNGVELARRVGAADRAAPLELFGLTCPLITTASGQKMGKTAAGAVWLSDRRMCAYDYWQFWRNTEDADVGRFMRLFTDMPMEEIARLERLAGAEINEAKKRLATEATALLHGREAAERAQATAHDTFEQGQTAKRGQTAEQEKMAAGLPTVEIVADRLSDGMPAFEMLVHAGLSKSNSEARRLIKGGGARINDAPIASEVDMVTRAEITSDGVIKVSSGKKRHILIRPV